MNKDQLQEQERQAKVTHNPLREAVFGLVCGTILLIGAVLFCTLFLGLKIFP